MANGVPMFMDANLAIMKTVFARVARQFGSLAEFKNLHGVSPDTLILMLALLSEPVAPPASLALPLSTMQCASESVGRTFQTKDGPLVMDNSLLRLDEGMISGVDLIVVDAVQSCSLEPLFKFPFPEYSISALALINSANVVLSPPLLKRIVGSSEPMFMEFARLYPELKESLRRALPSVRFPSLLAFILTMVGVNALTILHGTDDSALEYDGSVGLPLPPGDIYSGTDSLGVLALAVLMYSHCPIDDLPLFFDRCELADRLAAVCSRWGVLPPGQLRAVCLSFIEAQWAANRANPKFLARRFPQMYSLHLHARLMNGIDLSPVLREASAFAADYDKDHMRWLIEKFQLTTRQK
jgi:hypothetical protein